jgi:hypothetical protein
MVNVFDTLINNTMGMPKTRSKRVSYNLKRSIMENSKNELRPEKDEKFVLVHLGKSKDGTSVINSKGFATAVKLNEHVQSLAKEKGHS